MIDVVLFSTPGKEAEHAANVFYYLTYEGSVNLDSVDNSVAKEVCHTFVEPFCCSIFFLELVYCT